MKRLLALAALLAAAWLTRPRRALPDRRTAGWAYAARVSDRQRRNPPRPGWMVPAEWLVEPFDWRVDPADAIQVDPSLHERAGL